MNLFLEQIIHGIASGSAYTLMALGFTMVYGILGIINFAHGELYMIGAYIGYYLCLKLGFHYLLSIPFAMVGVALIGILIERVVFRPLRGAPGLSMLTVSLGLSIALLNTALVVFTPDPRLFNSPYNFKFLEIGGISISFQRIFIFLVAIGLIIGLYFLISRTYLGKAIRATAQDFEMAWMLGINPNRIARYTFTIGSALAAAAGILIIPILSLEPFVGENAILKAFVVVVIGGFGSIPGAIVAGYFLGFIESMISGFISPNYQNIISFLIMILMLLIKPSGIFGEVTEENI
jgi:branched-chain amino acid transport system permease protein